VFVSGQVISDRFAGQYHEHISGVFDVNYVQDRADDLDWSRTLCFEVKARQIPYLDLLRTARHQASAFVLNDFLDLS
jgi:hypothetical protein